MTEQWMNEAHGFANDLDLAVSEIYSLQQKLENAEKQTAELQQEVEMLTKALQQIIETTDGSNPTHFQIWSIAKKALKPPTK